MSLQFHPLASEVYDSEQQLDTATTERMRLFRSKIPGGWIVLATSPVAGSQQERLTFVPDPDHTWNGESLP